MPKDNPKPRYLLVNADESEPGTFKDRQIIENNPHLLIESSVARRPSRSRATRRTSTSAASSRAAPRFSTRRWRRRVAAGHLGKNIYGSGFDLDLYVHRGAGAYICGEETGLIESLEGKRAYPRVKPPFPAVYGVFGAPTIVNNVETLCCVRPIIERGAEWFKTHRSREEPGPEALLRQRTRRAPGRLRVADGHALCARSSTTTAAASAAAKQLKAVIPGGSSVPVLTADEIDVDMDFDSVAAAGSLLGSCGTIVMDEDTCMVRALRIIAHFYHHESCGQCTPCREGTGWLERLLIGLEEGGADAARSRPA